jgi:hypothetical protein
MHKIMPPRTTASGTTEPAAHRLATTPHTWREPIGHAYLAHIGPLTNQ